MVALNISNQIASFARIDVAEEENDAEEQVKDLQFAFMAYTSSSSSEMDNSSSNPSNCTSDNATSKLITLIVPGSYKKKSSIFVQLQVIEVMKLGAVELCLLDWGFQNVFGVAVDNASSNGTAMEYVKDGIKELSGSVDSVRAAVRYVRQSPARLRKFMEYAKLEKIETEKSLCLDVPTRWNSTYLMLSVAILYERAFDRLATEDYVYTTDLMMNDGPGAPHSVDWENMKRLVGFLRHFYELTLKVSGTKYITSNGYVDSRSCIHVILKECSSSEDVGVKGMGVSMKKKFDKYWGNVEKFNLLVFIASAFDPRNKFVYLESDESTPSVSQPTSSVDQSLFSNYGDAISALREIIVAKVKKRKLEVGTGTRKSELDRYLTKEIEEDTHYFASKDFSVLD
ncbi:uncharacterized protein LOC143539778 [Bidens hawaiensis]|uniref:uncharacterized protein LOC143539778 n=1 Tax=Bidens hawaiensis TaxID=980011 RepID=UPI00404B90C7